MVIERSQNHNNGDFDTSAGSVNFNHRLKGLRHRDSSLATEFLTNKKIV